MSEIVSVLVSTLSLISAFVLTCALIFYLTDKRDNISRRLRSTYWGRKLNESYGFSPSSHKFVKYHKYFDLDAALIMMIRQCDIKSVREVINLNIIVDVKDPFSVIEEAILVKDGKIFNILYDSFRMYHPEMKMVVSDMIKGWKPAMKKLMDV